jgi:hypothetical protein
MKALRLRTFILSSLTCLSMSAMACAQPPTLNPPFPLGAQRGTTLELTLTGTNLADPTAVVTSFPAKVSIPTENNNGKDNAKFVARLEVPKDAPLGWHTIRVATRRGVSNLRLFCIDDLPQVLEQDTNRSALTPQLIPVPCVVCGRGDNEATDYYKFVAQAGQRLSFEILGRRLGSQIDPQISLLHALSRRQLAFSDDAPGQSKDSRFTYTFKETGEYLLEVRDVRYQGGPDWFYRLRIGDFPLATTPVPLAAKRGSSVQVHFAGPNVPDRPPQRVTVPSDPSLEALYLTPLWQSGGPPGWPVALMLSDLDEAVEVEPNDDPAKPNRVTVPGAVNARFEKLAEKDHFVFAAKKGVRLIIEAQTQEFFSPTSVYMVLKDSKGAQVGASDPMKDPARIDFTPPADGDYTLMVEHLHYWGGPAETYRVSFVPYEPGFSLAVAADHFDVGQGTSAVVTVQATRRDYAGPIEVNVASAGGLTGSATIPANQTAVLLSLAAAPGATPGVQRLVLMGKATINGKPVTEQASITGVVRTALGNLPFPPPLLGKELAVAVIDKPPFTIEAKYDHPEGIRGLAVPVTITAAKSSGFDEEITITTIGLPPPQGQQPAVPPVTAKIAKGQNQTKVELKPIPNAPLGALPLAFVGKAKAASVEHTVATPVTPLVLSLPFELQVDAGGGKLQLAGALTAKMPGPFHVADLVSGFPKPIVFGPLDLPAVKPASDKLKIKVKAVRKGGYKGPIALEVRNLPANVAAAKVTIAENQNEADMELTAAANAALGDKADVNVLGTASAAGNQQNASPNFKISVQK